MVVVPAALPEARIHAAPLGRPIEVLIVDSQPLFLDALCTILEAPPLSAMVTKCVRSDMALEIVRRQNVDLVLCELGSVPLSGLQLVTVLAAEFPAIPITLLADQRDTDQLTEAMNSTAAGFFTKDASLDEFLVGVRAVLGGNRAIGARLMNRLLARLAVLPADSLRHGGRPLSRTELEILTMVGDAESIASIAASRGISNKTVRNHLARIYRKLELRGRTDAVLWAARSGLTSR